MSPTHRPGTTPGFTLDDRPLFIESAVQTAGRGRASRPQYPGLTIPPLAGEQADLLHPLDRLAAGGDAELAVDRQGLGLHRVLGQVQLLAHLAKGEVGGQQRKQAQLGGGKRRRRR